MSNNRKLINEEFLEKYPCYIVSGLYFNNDYCFWLLNYQNASTPWGGFSEAFIFFPNGKRYSYIDPIEANHIPKYYHACDKVVGAKLNWTWLNNKLLLFSLKGQDGRDLKFEIQFSENTLYRLLNYALKITPAKIQNTKCFMVLMEKGGQLFLRTGRQYLWGKTITGKIFRLQPWRSMPVTNAIGFMDSRPLGKLIHPRRSIAFGDCRSPEKPLISFATNYLEKMILHDDKDIV